MILYAGYKSGRCIEYTAIQGTVEIASVWNRRPGLKKPLDSPPKIWYSSQERCRRQQVSKDVSSNAPAED